MAKVIHVHLLNRPRDKRKDYYFASISAIYTILSSEDVGATKNYLLHAGLSGNGSVTTKCALSSSPRSFAVIEIQKENYREIKEM